MSVGQKEAFELFRRDHELNEKMENNKRQLKQFHVQARKLGDELKHSKTVLGNFYYGTNTELFYHFPSLFKILVLLK